MSDRQSENEAGTEKSDPSVVDPDIAGDIVTARDSAKPAALADPSVAAVGREAAAEPLYDLVEVAPAAASKPSFATARPLGETPVEPTAGDASAADVGNETQVVEPNAVPQQTIWAPSPDAPANKGNRRVGTLIAVVSSVIFAALFAVTLAIILSADGAGVRFDFVASIEFYIPVIFFVVGFIILVSIANRAGWWAYVLGSIFVAAFVYFGTVATGLVIGGVFLETSAGAERLFAVALTNPFVIAAALIAREVSMWMGAIVAARGRRVKARNMESRASFHRDSAERHAQYEQSRYRAPEPAA